VSDYTAADIVVLREDELSDRFLWVKAGELARQYPHAPVEFIERMLVACEAARFDVQCAIARYLAGDKTVPVTEEFLAAFTEERRSHRARGWA
jgi:hypothetical protein